MASLVLNTNVSPKPYGFSVLMKFMMGDLQKNVFAVVNRSVCIIFLAQRANYDTIEVTFWIMSSLLPILVPLSHH